MMTRACTLGFVLLCTSAVSFAQLDQVTKDLGSGNQSELSDSKVASGLKEALQIGADNAVKLTGKTDGYFGNQPSRFCCLRISSPCKRGLVQSAISQRLMLLSLA